MTHPAWIEIDVGALAHNARVLRRAIPAGTALGLMVKANGYGHDSILASRSALAGGADLLMTASLDEALEVRAAGIEAPLLVVYPVPPEAVLDAVARDIQLSIASADGARRVLSACGEAKRSPGSAGGAASGSPGRALRLHVEVDTGMGRGGIAPGELGQVAAAIDETAGAELASVWTHLADGSDPVASAEQTRRYEAALADLAATGRPMPLRHVAASEGLFVATAPSYDLVRIGLAYYGELGVGVEPAPSMAGLAAELRPAMTVKARPVRLESVPAGTPIGYGSEWATARPSTIATLPIGYADGWARAYWPGASALVRERRVPLVGRVSMDSVCADVTDVAGVTPDDEFVLLGAQGAERITAVELARLRGSIPNEVFCAFGGRLRRVAVGGS